MKLSVGLEVTLSGMDDVRRWEGPAKVAGQSYSGCFVYIATEMAVKVHIKIDDDFDFDGCPMMQIEMHVGDRQQGVELKHRVWMRLFPPDARGNTIEISDLVGYYRKEKVTQQLMLKAYDGYDKDHPFKMPDKKSIRRGSLTIIIRLGSMINQVRFMSRSRPYILEFHPRSIPVGGMASLLAGLPAGTRGELGRPGDDGRTLVAPPPPLVGLPRDEAPAALRPLAAANNERNAPAAPQRRKREINPAENSGGRAPKNPAATCQLLATEHERAGTMALHRRTRPVDTAESTQRPRGVGLDAFGALTNVERVPGASVTANRRPSGFDAAERVLEARRADEAAALAAYEQAKAARMLAEEEWKKEVKEANS